MVTRSICCSGINCAHQGRAASGTAGWMRTGAAALLAASLSVGCVGTVNDGREGPAPDGTSRPGGNEPGGPGPNGNGGSGGTGVQPSAGPRDPGRVTVRRLNQNEYDNTVRDLLGTELRPARTFLSDTSTNGFDNNGDLLSLSATHLDNYRRAAEQLAAEAVTTRKAAVISCDVATGATCQKSFITSFGERAFRRPLTTAEVDSYLGLATKVQGLGATPDETFRTVIEAMLMSSNFLFRFEFDSDPTSTKPHEINTWELASRLSYFIYGSMPDEGLFSAARAGTLTKPDEIKKQVGRMLSDPKGRAFANNFAEQWMNTTTLEALEKDKVLFKDWNIQLASSMRAEVRAFFDELVRENQPLEKLMNADFTYVDDRLAALYKLPAVGAAMKRVTLTAATKRGGYLTMGAPLTAHSRGNRTSPVERGRAALAELLCSPPPAPPDDLDLPSEDKIINARTQRDFLMEHRVKPVCAGCHTEMDNIGLALENFDPIGAWRNTDRDVTIDATGQLGGKTFQGAGELAALIAKDERFEPCISERLLSYATGRNPLISDRPYVQDFVKSGATNGLRDLITAVVTSEPFRMRRGEAP
ncbi:MAG TPA: DUF1592 domain-containing protein [Polyangia bacterium]